MLEIIAAVLASVMPVCDTEDSHQCTWSDESAVHVNVGPVTDDPSIITIR